MKLDLHTCGRFRYRIQYVDRDPEFKTSFAKPLKVRLLICYLPWNCTEVKLPSTFDISESENESTQMLITLLH